MPQQRKFFPAGRRGLRLRDHGHVLGSLTVIATSAVLAGMSFVGELWQVYVLLAVSIALSGSGFGGAILSPIVSSLIVSVGWRSAFLVLAAICMVAALPSRVQAVWHGRPRQGHGHHHLQAARKRGGE